MSSPGWRRFRQNKAATVGAVLVLLIALGAMFAPLFDAHDPSRKNVSGGLSAMGEPKAPSGDFLLGTDQMGRCVASRLMIGARVSLLVALAAALIATLIGTMVGLWAGYSGGWIDAALMRLVDLLLAFPFLLLVIALAAVFAEAGLTAVLVVLGLTSWTGVARVVRSKVVSVRELEYVSGARAVGAGTGRVLLRHVLPNVIAPVVVMATISVAQMILAESTLAFLGFGAPPPTATWGRMLFEGRAYMTGAPWLALAPGVALMITVLAFNLLGDGLRDALDPRGDKKA